jgi:hypothetical protein
MMSVAVGDSGSGCLEKTTVALKTKTPFSSNEELSKWCLVGVHVYFAVVVRHIAWCKGSAHVGNMSMYMRCLCGRKGIAAQCA